MDKQIEDEKLDKILKAAQVSPTANNSRPQRIFVIKNNESLEKIRLFTSYCFNVPIVLMICYDKNAFGNAADGHDYEAVDATIATAHMMFEVYGLGIGSVWVRGYYKRELDKIFNLTDNLISVALLPIGYSAENSKPSSLHFRKH